MESSHNFSRTSKNMINFVLNSKDDFEHLCTSNGFSYQLFGGFVGIAMSVRPNVL